MALPKKGVSNFQALRLQHLLRLESSRHLFWAKPFQIENSLVLVDLIQHGLDGDQGILGSGLIGAAAARLAAVRHRATELILSCVADLIQPMPERAAGLDLCL